MKTGYLVKISSPGGESGKLIEVPMSDYRTANGITTAYRVETTIADRPVTIQLTEVKIDSPMPAKIFDLSSDVAALVQQGAELKH